MQRGQAGAINTRAQLSGQPLAPCQLCVNTVTGQKVQTQQRPGRGTMNAVRRGQERRHAHARFQLASSVLDVTAIRRSFESAAQTLAIGIAGCQLQSRPVTPGYSQTVPGGSAGPGVRDGNSSR